MDRERRAVLKATGLLGGTALLGGATGVVGPTVAQEVDTELPPGVVLFDLDGDGEYDAEVEAAPESMRGGDRTRPIHVTSRGRATVDYAASVVRPEGEVSLGDLDRLAYDRYRGPEDGSGEGDAADETFLVVENDDGRHGMYLTDETDPGSEEWQTSDVLARVNGNTGGTSGWFEYTEIEDGYEGQTFDDAVARFGSEARLVRVGVGHGNAVTPTVLDAFFANLVVGGQRYEFPTSVARRASGANPV
ncbi:hypothetical protein NGM10_12835 [Halorussus salilacus]|uniref:hypothetical protein n=1 Tax=Halorussus salilacus TaxID=2953750 RepID=UPI00209FA20F|nr:hypothetical protein [Halorussus salilacus]USZ67609.1 hypothetical protein NGM10_12835 [Halorussus salilacus]